MTSLGEQSFSVSPVIRLTLLSLYGALTIPLPFLAKTTASPIPSLFLWLAILLGSLFLWAVLGEKVIVNQEEIKLIYPRWLPRKGWSLNWSQIKELKLRTTGQGGIVYYFVTQARDRAYLLPMRIAGFSRLLEYITTQTGLDTANIRPLAQPWMYFLLFLLSLFLWLVDAWVIWNAQ
jgi:hypothetical protein